MTSAKDIGGGKVRKNKTRATKSHFYKVLPHSFLILSLFMMI